MKRVIIILLSLITTGQVYSQIQTINVGTSSNDRTGDPLRTAFQKVNSNFTYVDGLIDDNAERIDSLVDAGSGGGTWGSITGTLSNQTDLNTALGLKAATTYVDAQDAGKQNIDGDLTSIAALSGTGYPFKSGVNTWVLTDPLSLTTIGTSGAATFASNVFNIPRYDTYTDTQVATKQNTLTNSAGLASALSDESGTGTVVFSSVTDGKQNTLTNSAGLASALSDESGTGTVAFTSYVDAKVTDGTITDGATTTAPSNDDVFDALALKAERTREYIVACSDLTTALTTGTSKAYFRVPRGFTITAVRASVLTAQSSGSILTIDINDGGTTILSTKLTIDNSEKTSTTAATAAVISDTAFSDDAEITIDIDQVGTGGAGLIVTIIGY